MAKPERVFYTCDSPDTKANVDNLKDNLVIWALREENRSIVDGMNIDSLDTLLKIYKDDFVIDKITKFSEIFGKGDKDGTSLNSGDAFEALFNTGKVIYKEDSDGNRILNKKTGQPIVDAEAMGIGYRKRNEPVADRILRIHGVTYPTEFKAYTTEKKNESGYAGLQSVSIYADVTKEFENKRKEIEDDIAKIFKENHTGSIVELTGKGGTGWMSGTYKKATSGPKKGELELAGSHVGPDFNDLLALKDNELSTSEVVKKIKSDIATRFIVKFPNLLSTTGVKQTVSGSFKEKNEINKFSYKNVRLGLGLFIFKPDGTIDDAKLQDLVNQVIKIAKIVKYVPPEQVTQIGENINVKKVIKLKFHLETGNRNTLFRAYNYIAKSSSGSGGSSFGWKDFDDFTDDYNASPQNIDIVPNPEVGTGISK